MSSGLASPLLISVLVHLLGLTALSVMGSALWSHQASPPDFITADLVLTPPAPAPEVSVSQPHPSPISPPILKAIPAPVAVAPRQAVVLPAVTPPVRQKMTPPKPVIKTLTPLAKTSPPKPLSQKRQTRRPDLQHPVQTPTAPKPGRPLPLPVENKKPTGNVLGPPAAQPDKTPPLAPAEGAQAGAGEVFEGGDAGVVPGESASGGGGGSGRAGLGTGDSESHQRVAGLQPGAGGKGLGGGAGPLARPLGGYQVKPHYPESARRRGIEGTTLLKVHVSERGRVKDILIERSAGYQELDLAALKAVKKWQFEPAKQGSRPVAVWVMLPVRFDLR